MEVMEVQEENMKSGKSRLVPALYIIIICLILLSGYLGFQLSKKPSEVIKNVVEIKPDKEWYKEDCKCIEWRIGKECAEGYVLNGTMCLDANTNSVTNPIKPCSKYDCGNVTVFLKK